METVCVDDRVAVISTELKPIRRLRSVYAADCRYSSHKGGDLSCIKGGTALHEDQSMGPVSGISEAVIN